MRDPAALLPWVEGCVRRHWRTRKFRRLLTTVGGMSEEGYASALAGERGLLGPACAAVAEECARRVAERDISGLPPVRVSERVDRSSGKLRTIGSESAMQQVLDAVAVGAAGEVWARRIVPAQASSMPGGGQVSGMLTVRRWVAEDDRAERWARSHGARYSRKVRWHTVIDLRKYFDHLRPDVFMSLFERDCANRDLLWLWRSLLATHTAAGLPGVMIGALTSQYAALYTMSFVYRHVMSYRVRRRGRDVRPCTRMLMQMDDQLVCARSRKDLLAAVREAVAFCRELCLGVKPGWQALDIRRSGIDLMGFVVHAGGGVSLRPRLYVRVRRIYLRLMRRKVPSLSQAMRACSYLGWLVHAGGERALRRLRARDVAARAAAVVSVYARNGRFADAG